MAPQSNPIFKILSLRGPKHINETISKKAANARSKEVEKKCTAVKARNEELKEKSKTEEPILSKLQQAKKKRDELKKKIKDIKAIRQKAAATYSLQLKIQQENLPKISTPSALTQKDVLTKMYAQIFGKNESVNTNITLAPARPKFDDTSKKILKNSLTDSESKAYIEIEKQYNLEVPAAYQTYEHFNDFTTSVIEDLLNQADDACREIQVWEDEGTRPDTTRPPPQITDTNRPSVRAIGFGDLIVAREHLIGYEANEIAHIENVLPHEERLREHEQITKREVLTETETLEETRSEKDLETTDRYELQTQSQKTINSQFKLDAGLNTSGTYGLTTVETSLQGEFSRSVEESKSTTSKLAREIVSKAVEETHKSVRELRRVTVTEQIKELNRHGIDASGSNSPFSGVYYWVEKIQEVELRHYGTRLMIEFFIPEPGLSMLPGNNQETQPFRKPSPLKIGPEDIDESNFRCLAKIYGAVDITPPPDECVQVGYSWASIPAKESAKEAEQGQEVKTDTVAIPDGYIPVEASVSVTGKLSYTGDIDNESLYDWVDVFVALGGQIIYTPDLAGQGTTYQRCPITLDTALPAPQGIPLSIRIAGAKNNTCVVNIRITCNRTDTLFHSWQLKTFERIKEAHAVLLSEYERKVRLAEISAGIQISGRNPEENRLREIEELKKWAIKTMRIRPFNYDAVIQELGNQEIDPLYSDEYAPIVRFFEDAFEWRQMSYILFPYYWGRRESYGYRQGIMDPDPLHQAFLRAGAARVIAPVTPGYEERILHYLDTQNQNSIEEEVARVTWQPLPVDAAITAISTSDSPVADVWLEVLMNKNEDIQRGSGTLNVTHNSDKVLINSDSLWHADSRDIGREIYIKGEVYSIIDIINTPTPGSGFHINTKFNLDSDQNASYAIGSVPLGEPWRVRLPTSLVILSDQKHKLVKDINAKTLGEDDPLPAGAA